MELEHNPWCYNTFRRKIGQARTTIEKNPNWKIPNNKTITDTDTIKRKAKDIALILCENNTFDGVIKILDSLSKHKALRPHLKGVRIGQSIQQWQKQQ